MKKMIFLYGIFFMHSILFSQDAVINSLTVGRGGGNNISNVAMGSRALNGSNQYGYNVAVGIDALLSQTSGYYNIAIGPLALKDNTDQFNLVAIGLQALEKNSTGYYNVAVGSNVLGKNTSGNNNAGFGHQALFENISGTYNLALGALPLYSNTTGSYNIAIGSEALKSNVSATYNAAVGVQALFANTTGANNFALGAFALRNNIDGANNIAIGNESGRYSTAGTNVSKVDNSVFIGYDARPSAASGNLNEVVIGYQGRGNGSNTTTIGGSSTTHTVLQYGETLIGYSAPQDRGSYALQVNGQIYATNATIATSDARLKERIEPLPSGLKEVMALRPCTFDFKQGSGQNLSKERQIGFVAQEVAKVIEGQDFLKSVVQEAGGNLGIAETKLIPLLVKAIQEQQVQIEALRRELERVSSKLVASGDK